MSFGRTGWLFREVRQCSGLAFGFLILPLLVICLVVAGTVWKGFRLVCLFAVAGMEGLSDELRNKLTLNVSASLSREILVMHRWKVWLRLSSEAWAPVPPASFTSVTSPAWSLFTYLLMGWKVCSSTILGTKYLQ